MRRWKKLQISGSNALIVCEGEAICFAGAKGVYQG